MSSAVILYDKNYYKNMKKIILTLLLSIPFIVNAQIISEKDVKITESGAKKLQDSPKKIYFREFTIGYQYIIESSTSGYDGKSKTNISMTAGLVSELSDDDIQNITDNAYQKVAKSLQQAGFTIVTTDEAKAIGEFKGRNNIFVGGQSILLGGRIYTAPKGTKYLRSPAGNAVKVSEELGNIPVIDLGVNIDFASIIEDKQAGGSSVLKGEFGLGAYPFKSTITRKGNGKFGNAETVIQLSSKNYKAIEIEGVIAKEKISKRAEGEYRYDWGNNLKYAQNKKVAITNPVKADKQMYITKVSQALDDYLDIFISQLIENSK